MFSRAWLHVFAQVMVAYRSSSETHSRTLYKMGKREIPGDEHEANYYSDTPFHGFWRHLVWGQTHKNYSKCMGKGGSSMPNNLLQHSQKFAQEDSLARACIHLLVELCSGIRFSNADV